MILRRVIPALCRRYASSSLVLVKVSFSTFLKAKAEAKAVALWTLRCDLTHRGIINRGRIESKSPDSNNAFFNTVHLGYFLIPDGI